MNHTPTHTSLLSTNNSLRCICIRLPVHSALSVRKAARGLSTTSLSTIGVAFNKPRSGNQAVKYRKRRSTLRSRSTPQNSNKDSSEKGFVGPKRNPTYRSKSNRKAISVSLRPSKTTKSARINVTLPGEMNPECTSNTCETKPNDTTTDFSGDSSQKIRSIACLTAGHLNDKIKSRVRVRSSISIWSEDSRTGEFSSSDIMDKTRNTRIIASDESCDASYEMFQKN